MSKSSSKKKSNGKPQKAYVSPNKKKNGNGALIWLSLAIVAVAVVVILGINNQSKTANEAYAFDYASMPRLGNEEAPVKIVEFGDYQCTSCKTFSEVFKPQLEKDFIESGKASLSFANYTIIGPDSKTAAEAAEAVHDQNPDAYWKYHTALFAAQGGENSGWAKPDNLVKIAKDAKIDVDYDKLSDAIGKGAHQDLIEKQYSLASTRLGVTGTPTLFINGKLVSFRDYNDLKSQIEAASKQ